MSKKKYDTLRRRAAILHFLAKKIGKEKTKTAIVDAVKEIPLFNSYSQSKLTGDWKKLESDWEDFEEYASLLGIPMPAITKYSLGGRKFTELINQENRERRENLAAFAVASQIEGNTPLIPEATTFWGAGTTTYYTFRELVRAENKHRLTSSVWTANLEIAQLLYASAPPEFADNKNAHLHLVGCKVDWSDGGLVSSLNPDVSAAIISFDWMDTTGTMWSRTNINQIVTQQFEHVKHRIIIIADSSKIGKSQRGAEVTSIPPGRQVYLVTDDEIPSDVILPVDEDHLLVMPKGWTRNRQIT